MKRLILSLFALLIITGSWAQHSKPSFSFNETSHNFGDIKEADGKVTVDFAFTNTGSLPLVIHNVRASCGCTTPEWTKKPVPPGGKGTVKATFDPHGRPGNFNKTITVTANTENPNTILRITGNVIEREKTVEDIYPREMGQIRLNSTHLSFTKIAPDAKKSEELEVINTSNEKVTIDFDKVPSHMTIKAEPSVLAPGAKGKILATYDASKKNDWGFVYDQVYLTLNGTKDYKNRISVNANIQENFDNWTEEQKANAAKIKVDNKVYNFGIIKQGEKAQHTYKITNAGKSNLVIRKVKASCGCTATTPEKTVIAPGETTNINAVFNSAGKSGRQNKSITVITNDPLESDILLRIEGTVE